LYSWHPDTGGTAVTTGAKAVDVELTPDELVALLAGVRPDSTLVPRLVEAGRVRRQHPLDGIRFWFTGTEAETYALLDLAATRAPSAVSRIKRGLLLAQA